MRSCSKRQCEKRRRFWYRILEKVICPSPNKSGLAVTPLKSTPEVALPPSVNGMAIIWVTSFTEARVRGPLNQVAKAGGNCGRFAWLVDCELRRFWLAVD